MRLVHLADLHLGFRQYQRSTPSGINQREVDVAAAATRAFAKVVSLKPEIVVFSGDIFHSVRPSNTAIIHAYRLFADLRKALPDAAMVMIAGNHDAPRTQETGCVLPLFRELGIHVADHRAAGFVFPDRDLSILAVPFSHDTERPPLIPDSAYRYNVLVLHGQIAGMLPVQHSSPTQSGMEISTDELHADAWSYIALGHYHVYSKVQERAYYSGSIEYTTTNPWGELREQEWSGVRGKGFIEHDLASNEHHFHVVPQSRRLMDLESINAAGLTAAEIDAQIRARVESASGGIDDNIVRIRINAIPRHVVRELDHSAIREYRRRAVSFHLDVRAPDPLKRRVGGAAPGRRATLPEIVRERLNGRQLTPGMDRSAFVDIGMRYLGEAEEQLSVSLPMVEE